MMIQDYQLYRYNSPLIVLPNPVNNRMIPGYQNSYYSLNNTFQNTSNALMPQFFVSTPQMSSYDIKQPPLLSQCKNSKLNVHSKSSSIRTTAPKCKDKSKDNKNERKKFSPEEDEKLKELVEKMGSKRWNAIAKEMPGRSGRQCRDRYKNYLVPGFFNGQWSREEDQLLFQKYLEFGSQWSKITQYFKNRSANSLKNRWNYFVSKHMEFQFNPSAITSVINKNDNAMKIVDDSENEYDEMNNDETNNDETNNDDIFCKGIINYDVPFNYYIDTAFNLYGDDVINSNDHLDIKDDSLDFP